MIYIIETVSSTGGPVVWLLIVLSITALTVIFYKLWHFRYLGIEQRLAAEFFEHFAKKEFAQARMLIQGAKSPRAKILHRALDLIEHTQLKQQECKAELLRIAKAKYHELSAYLRPLEIIATIAPLMGLFGTVLGMINAFQAMETAGTSVDPSVLSGGIWQALLTTAVGLAVAIPVSILHGWFERRVENQASQYEDDLQRFFTLIALEGSTAHKKISNA